MCPRYGVTTGGMNIGGFGGGELMSMVPQLMSIANVGGGRQAGVTGKR